MRVALVHDWLTGMRGGERVLEALLDLFPHATIHTLIHVRGSVSERIERRPIVTTFLQGMPGVRKRYRHLLPLFPAAIEGLDLAGADLVISSSHCVAKGVRVPPGARHLCYCHTPMRYVWDQHDEYFGPGRASLPVRAAMRVIGPRLRDWDVRTARSVDAFVANSSFVRDRIWRAYGRTSAVVHPPVDVDRFAPRPKEDFYLMVGAQAPYKRVDLAVEAMRKLGRRLLVVGDPTASGSGTAPRWVKGGADRVEWLGWLPDCEVADLLGRAKALLLPGVEDFGIVVVEALASGTPVVALGRGGVRDSVRSGETGVFFDEPTVEALTGAVIRFETLSFDPEALAQSARRFGLERFRKEMSAQVGALLARQPPTVP